VKPTPKQTRDWLPALLVAALGAAGVALTQPGLSRSLHATKAREDVYLFPPPAELRVATLGYRAAVVDMLWAKLRVEYGMHLVEKRPFPDTSHYLDALLELEPNYPQVFKYVETMLCYRQDGGTVADAHQVRAYLERGIAARPDDYEVWLHYGQFMAFMAASYLKSREEIEQWRIVGASALARAAELSDDPTRSIEAANLLNTGGEREAAVRTLERAYSLTDDEPTREHIAQKLASLHAEDVRDRAKEDGGFIERVWRDEWPFLPRAAALLVGPGRNTLACVGGAAAHEPACSADWQPRLPSSRHDESARH
jgi:tetratricopeptide (TPR) repeat protein